MRPPGVEPRDERFCREALVNCLQSSGSTVTWSRGSDPPDYEFKIDGQVFAVEITQIVEQQQRNGPLPLSQVGLQAMISDLTKRIREGVQTRSPLNGHYILEFSGSGHNFEASKKDLEKMCVTEMESTRNIRSFPLRPIEARQGYTVWMKKVDSPVATVSCVSCYSDTGICEGEITDEFRRLTSDAIDRKRKNRQLTTRDEPVVLVLLDRYHLAWAGGLLQRVLAEVDVSPFAAAYVVTDDQVAHRIPK